MVPVQSPGYFYRTNLAKSVAQSGSNFIGGTPNPRISVIGRSIAETMGGAQPAGTQGYYGLRWLWMLYFAGLFGLGFYLIRRTLINRGARPDAKAPIISEAHELPPNG
jgi:hypothetical protein